MSIDQNVVEGLSMKLQGYLLGYQVLQNGVIVQDMRYDKPVPNVVTNVGKAALLYTQNLSYGQVNELDTLFGGVYSSTLYSSGMLYSCGRGSGNTPATVNDTALVSMIGNRTSSFLSGDPNTGTRYDKENGKIIMRVTHDHEAETSIDKEINEIGYYGGRYGAYVLFSRIVLPSTVTVLVGQSLRTVYQLEVTVSPATTPTTFSSFPVTGTGWSTATGSYRLIADFPATTATFGSVGNSLMPVISTTGSYVSSTNGYNYLGYHTLNPRNAPSTPGTMGGESVSMFGTAQNFSSYPWGTNTLVGAASSTRWNAGYNDSSGTATGTTQAMTATQTYRDRTYVFSPNWPGYSPISIYAISIRGLMYIFDTPVTKSNTQRLTLVYRVSVT